MAKSTKLSKEIATEFHKKVKDLRNFMKKHGIRIAYDCTGGLHEFAVLPDGFWPIGLTGLPKRGLKTQQHFG